LYVFHPGELVMQRFVIADLSDACEWFLIEEQHHDPVLLLDIHRRAM